MRPRDLLTWTGYGLLRLLSRLPWSLCVRLGPGLGRHVLYHLMRGPRHAARVNLRLVHPDLDAAGVEALVRRHFTELGFSLFELGRAWWGSDEELAALVDVEGWEHLEAARADGRGLILLTAHTTNLEFGGSIMSRRLPIMVTYKPDKDPLTDRLIRHRRASLSTTDGHGVVPADDVRGMLRVLRRGGVLWYAPDIDYRREGKVFADFLGVPAATAPHPAKIAAHGNARMVPYILLRRPDGRYRLVVEPALEGFPSGDAEADTRRINAALSALVARAPDSYLWIMRRFRTRPGGGRNPYRA